MRSRSFTGRIYALVLGLSLLGAGLGLAGVRSALRSEEESLVASGLAPTRAREVSARLRGPLVASVLGGSTLAALITATWIVAIARKRLKTLTRSLERVAAADLRVDLPEPPAEEFQDVRESFRLLRDAIDETRSSLEATDAERRRKLARLAHDLSNPVMSIMGIADELGDPDTHRDDPQRAARWTALNGEIDRVTALLQDLRALARSRDNA